MANSSRHPIVKFGTRPATNGVMAWPMMPTMKVETEIRPRCKAGDISPTYVDARFSAAPTPMQVTNRQTDKLGRPVASAQPREPTPLITSELAETRAQVAKIARNTAELIGLGRELRDEEITVLEGWAGDYYGIPVQSTLDAIRLTGSLEGVILDPVYEGKSMAGLIDLVRQGDISKDSTVLYAHLGGQPALNAYSALFRS